MAFAVDGIDHVEVFVRDIPASLQWYEDVLGLKQAGGWDPEPKLIGAGENYLALFRARTHGSDNSDDEKQPPIRWRRVAWRTTKRKFAFAQEHLRAKDVHFDGPVDHGDSQSIYFNDPDGNPLEITCEI
jgi:catechol 2,3-dioxygenase